jgi:hypothetical protein
MTDRPQVLSVLIQVLITGKTASSLGRRIAQWNSALPHFVNGFLSNHSDIAVAVYDAHKLFTEVLDNPTKYGFRDAISQCHKSDCIWADDIHSTFATHKIVAADLARFLGNPSATASPMPPGSSPKSTSTKRSTINMASLAIAHVAVGLLVGILSGGEFFNGMGLM